MQGWTGRRLCIDLDLQQSRVEEIPRKDVQEFVGGRGLNAKYLSEWMPGTIFITAIKAIILTSHLIKKPFIAIPRITILSYFVFQFGYKVLYFFQLRDAK